MKIRAFDRELLYVECVGRCHLDGNHTCAYGEVRIMHTDDRSDSVC